MTAIVWPSSEPLGIAIVAVLIIVLALIGVWSRGRAHRSIRFGVFIERERFTREELRDDDWPSLDDDAPTKIEPGRWPEEK